MFGPASGQRSFLHRLGKRAAMRSTRWWRASVVLVLLAGCAPPRTRYPESLQSKNPAERLQAIKQAGEQHDEGAIGLLVDRLEDEDPAVRLYAILALEKLTGTRLGYDYHGSERSRERAVQRWRRYLLERDARPSVVADGEAGSEGGPGS